ncbi:hypothetical protein CLMAG_56230 [Clostridium magnum DSM 2767]|uniref:Uncharacterized protein n=1 Tax=Clostridium magnum DSM 2767 TaxID=1121326 RepID=A0A162QY56_9CLOT|nr:hypothetical protein CLMAG_56230 [Clostridium magnum DSM 2767]
MVARNKVTFIFQVLVLVAVIGGSALASYLNN